MPTLLWRLSIRTSDETKARRVLRRVEETLDCPLRIVSCLQSLEDSAFWDARFETDVGAHQLDGPNLVWQCLTLAGRLVPHGWRVSTPEAYPDGGVTFDGVWAGKNGCSVAGIEWVHFDLAAGAGASTPAD